MSATASTGSPGLRRTPGAKPSQMEENIKVGKEDSSQANVSELLTSLLRFQLVSICRVSQVIISKQSMAGMAVLTWRSSYCPCI